jgi:hypothetical protein
MAKTRQRKSRIRRKRTRSSTGRGLESASSNSEIRLDLYVVNTTAGYTKTRIAENVTADEAAVLAKNYSTEHNSLPLEPKITYNTVSVHWSFPVTGQRKTPVASSKN